MDVYNKNIAMRARHLDPDSLIFSMYTSEELRKLCITKICTPLTFDPLGYPLPGGLYDKSLGPLTEKSEPCTTCGKNIFYCAGHFGYMELPLPVVNPLFHKTLGIILKISCFSCFRIQFPSHVKYSLSLQIQLLNRGFIAEAMDIEIKLQDLISNKKKSELQEDDLVSIREYENLILNDTIKLNAEINNNKNTEAVRNGFVNEKLRGLPPRTTCMFCKSPLGKVQTIRNRIIISKTDNGDGKHIKSHQLKYVTPEESRTFLRKIWANEESFLKELAPVLTDIKSEHPTDIFYSDVIPVTPPNIRPANYLNGRVIEHDQSQLYKDILQNSMLLRTIIQVIQNDNDVNSLPMEAKAVYNQSQGEMPVEKLNNAWELLQTNVDWLIDKDPKNRNSSLGEGLKQVIEKKAGLIRMHMMGKRVNFSARSVITPDPNLNIEEIGIPEEFAKHLTYPVPVTSWNVTELRKMILNGPNVHPGAVYVEFEDGSVKRITPENLNFRESLIKRLLTPDDKEKGFVGVKKVHRHLCNGDVLLLNRQPTLHKPSIMAHTARILKGEKTLRLHYANCKAYNADFDGDEMNAHFPQNELARSEGYNIAHVCNQYLVPKDGTPLSGLIQDHVISGVRLTMRGQFFTKDDYQQLVFQALSFKMSNIKLLPPTILKPRPLWSGKQVLSTVIINVIPAGRPPINLTSTAKIGAKAWQTQPAREWKVGGSPFTNDNTMSEAEVIIRNGELLVGVLDKTHYGATPYGLVHCMYELYGGNYATKLLSSFAKLFTYFLQRDGFTLGVHDILVQSKADHKRGKIIKNCRRSGINAITTALDITHNITEKEIVEKIEEACFYNPKMRAIIDREYKLVLDPFTNDINKTCLPAGLICEFPYNNLQLMVQSGAKGSTVNTMQISCLLGQIELEGKRPPVMLSGKSLPSFPMFEFAPRAGGFIDGRFMTGIQPQEFFFHCMAGREGLIDTAVKTSRSGYLQRCLIKHLEGLSVGYDLTVRDSDRSVIQFLYGEDGMDVSKMQFLNQKQMKFLFENRKAIIDKEIIKNLRHSPENDEVKKHITEMKTWKKKHENPLEKRRQTGFTLFSNFVKDKIVIKNNNKRSSKSGRTKLTKHTTKAWKLADEDIQNGFKEQCKPCPNPINIDLQPDVYFGSLTDNLYKLMKSCKETRNGKTQKEFENMFKYKAMKSLCAPGEPVGLLAAQSIGEPSTQMTLNTFHFAGRGEMNVTLGIPRLREILMMASKNLKTPSMEIPFYNVPDLEKKTEHLKKILTRVTVAEVLEKIDVTGQMETQPIRQMVYHLRFSFLPHNLYKFKYNVNSKGILKHMTKRFFSQFFMTIRKYSKLNANVAYFQKDDNRSRNKANSDDEADDIPASAGPKNEEQEGSDNSDEEVEDDEDAKLTSKYDQAHDSQEPEDEEKETSDVEEDKENSGTVENTDDEETDQKQDTEAVNVIRSNNSIQNYRYDKKKHLWCELTFSLPLIHKKLDLTAILKEVASKSVIWETDNIKRAITYMKDDCLMLRTDGINIIEMFKYNQLLDLNKLYCNDIHKVAETYGIEAATKVIVKEVQEVFKVYGIEVNPRHLLLIADYMTYNGTFEPLSRRGMDNSSSPLQQMSFEASLNFLKTATIRAKQDNLQSPSSCLIVGKPCHTGTGSFTLLQKIPIK